MKKRKIQIEPELWQQHLSELNAEDSADNFFIKQIKYPSKSKFLEPEHDYFVSPFLSDEIEAENEGQLALDVYEKDEQIVIVATMAGANLDDLEVLLEGDVLTIKGERKNEETKSECDYFYKECYWGKFSRSIILPTEVNADDIDAKYKNGILIIKLKKIIKNISVKIKVDEIEE
ncbi:hypothetical protein A2533_00775 [Candidatus Falkowbacteria bacterium RIFOXYD2_FULL_35_9]|uniref:SHSP domain-containing protein n=1 Tax=Candidatus Falkowbacteria bacterium RIFOXYC2_FULL_36_12 TaxID=1798002 RepID=A0A1F5T306_9BACT|nr:MAG: hypothetical protein A2300_01205 [Candidatus Falkowbacteria bacterium RIFOXYB2_FULL_35_7]OGF33364.1 MAG: hypothetical protein A2478_01530 [Candidatus Falkowbacteria bacterium RIFOXYC2_FULL_36_12]OGF45609.1 MAG: hypothetical protein A2533_00775 [Candidatus Falkowbacteria bacterium RIFOXYD2_FULL_35_9]